MKAIDFVVRTSMGAVERDVIPNGDASTTIFVGSGKELSLNLGQDDMRGYSRDGNDLHLTLADGRVIILQQFFTTDGEAVSRLFISADGSLNEVSFTEGSNGVLFANYGQTEVWGKWSPSDELIFVDRPDVMVAEAAAVGVNDNDVSMLGLGLLGGGGLLGVGGAAAAVAGAAVIAGGTGGENTTPSRVIPTVDDPEATVVIGGDEADETVTVTGTGEPGSEVVVTIGDQTETTTTDDDGTWEVVFDGETFPDDGVHDVEVVVTDPDGTVTELDGPDVNIDTTPPATAVTDGTSTVNVIVNGADHEDGVTITGSGEAGATVVVTVGDSSETTTVTDTGTWEVTFDDTVFPAGEYETDITIVSTDASGNSTTVTDTVVIDTEAGPIDVANTIVETDGTINATELSDGFTVTGTSEPGSTVDVTIEGNTQQTTVNSDGSWSVTFGAGVLAGGEYDATVTAVTTDHVGNTNSTTTTIRVDTVGSVSISEGALEVDNIVNAAEVTDGVVLTGTSEPGSTVTVTVGNTTVDATVASDGSWTATIPATALPGGEYETTATVSATDGAGNTSSASRTIVVDTQTVASIDNGQSGGDDLINATEASNGVTLTGSAEPGASVEVGFLGQTYTATAGTDGAWAVSVPAANIPGGTYDAPITVTATDLAGNTQTATDSVHIDTEGDVTVNTANVETDGTINNAERADGVTLTGTAEPGSTVQVQVGGGAIRNATVDSAGNWTATFAPTDFPVGETTVPVTATATDAVGNVSTSSGSVNIDTLVTNFQMNNTAGGADRVINEVEHAAGVAFGGTTEPGSTVQVTLGGVSRAATVGADGNWTVNFAAGEIPTGEYTTTLTAVATDAAGNTRTLSELVQVDTDAGLLTISSNPVEGDDTINKVEAADGVILVGQANPGAVVSVTMGGVTHNVTTGANGIWQAPFAASEITPGTYDAPITATITDAAGNTKTVTDSVHVDTGVDNFDLSDTPIESNNEVNAVEAADGVVLTGTTEPGSTVQVTLGGVTHNAVVDANGNWTVTFPSTDIPDGEYDAPVTVTTTDVAGNVETTSANVGIDTYVNQLDLSATPAVMNGTAAANGLSLSGQVEPGSSVTVMFGGMAHVATVDAAGNWSVDIPASSIADGEYTATFTVEATDAAGNTDSLTETIAIDTVAPEGPIVEAVNFDRSGDIRDISVEMADDTLGVAHVQSDGSISDLSLHLTDIAPISETNVLFDNAIPDGSHLIVSRTDDAGNTTGSYVVVNESGTSNVNISNANLGDYQIESVDLSFAENSSLTITEAQLIALSDSSDQVTVYGGSDDSVTITGAVMTGTSTNSDGETFNVYSLGAEGTVLIDDDITNVTI